MTTITTVRRHSRRWARIAGAGAATLAVLAASACSGADSATTANLASGDLSRGADNFYTSDQVTMQPVKFKNQYQMDVTGNLFVPKNLAPGSRAAAMVVGHPMGAVKEQSANLYATKMAERGFVTLALDLAFWGGSAGEPRNAVAPDLYTETFSAGVDYLRTRDSVDPERIGALGICGSGSFVISAAKIDPRIKAVATVSMYDMGAANRNGLGHSVTPAQRQAILALAAAQRDVEFRGGPTEYTSGTVHELTSESTPIEREFYDFYRTQRGAVTPESASPDTTTHPTLSSNAKFMNFYPFNDIETISPRPMLFITGENAHSREFSEEAYRLAGERKELVIVPGAGHVDLYDRTELIPFDKLTSFYTQNLA
ncbi:alpha/beta hydrolase [Nocardia sp. 2YAB30]|uniref:alpha/beta hydrolase n=1 Tax=Nocardia sp. 2YAB30 TaxID=3233022 RepID=UPI003F9D6D1E